MSKKGPGVFGEATFFAVTTQNQRNVCSATKASSFPVRQLLGALVLSGTLGVAQSVLAASNAALSFSPASFIKGTTSALTLSLANDAASAVTFTVPTALSLPVTPTGLTFTTPAASTTCSGLGVTTSGSTLSFSGTGTIPANGSCTVTATVTSPTPNIYTVPLPAGFFHTSDGSNPPGNALNPTVTATAYQPATIALRSTRAANTASWPVNVLSSLYSDNALDLPTSTRTRFRFVLTNPNPVPLTNVSLPFPDLRPFNVIPDAPGSPGPAAFIAGSTNTSNAGISTGGTPVVSVGCGGTLAVESYTVTFSPRSKTFPPTPVTLSGATIPANGSCEVSFLARYDNADSGDSGTATLAFGSGLLVSNEGVSNATINLNQSYNWSNYLRTTTVSTSGFKDQIGTETLVFSNGGQTESQQVVSPSDVYWTVGAGITPNQTSYTAGAGCPPINWIIGTRRLEYAANAVVPAMTNCSYNVTFVSDYGGPSAYTDAQICTQAGPVTLPSTQVYNNKQVASPACATYRAIATTAAQNAGAVTVDAHMLDPVSGAVTDSIAPIYLGRATLLQLTLTAPLGVSNYSLTSSSSNITNYDQSLSYVPAASTTCAGGSVSAPVGSGAITVSGVNLAAGASCTVTVPVISGSTSISGPRFSLKACDGIGTVSGLSKCTAGQDKTFSAGGTYPISVKHAIAPAKSSMALADKSTVYRLTLSKPAGEQPIEGLSLTVNFAKNAGVDMGLQATEILSNSCKALVNGVSAVGPIPATSSAAITKASTPDADAQGPHGYTNAGTYDPAVFNASSCTLELKLVPSTPAAGSDTIVGTGGSTSFPINTGTATPITYSLVPGGSVPSPSYTLIAASPQPVTLVKTFSPSNIPAGGTSTMTVTLKNSISANTIDLTNVSLTDNYPMGLINAAPLTMTQLTKVSGSGTCSGTVTATAGGNSVALTNGAISADTDCAFTVNVSALDPNGVTNTIPTGNMSSTQGVGDTGAVSAAITLSASLGGVMQFTPASFNFDPVTVTNNVSALKVSVINSFANPATGVSLTGGLGTGLAFNNATVTPDPANDPGCNLGTTSASGTAFTMTGATLPGGKTCAFTLSVRVPTAPATNSAVYNATIAVGGIAGTVDGDPQLNSSEVKAELTVAKPATVVISKTVSGLTAGKPASGSYPVTLTCTNTATAALTLAATEATPVSQSVRANDTCTVTEGAKPSPLTGYAWGTQTITPNDGVTLTTGTVTTVAGATAAVGINNPLTATSQSITATSVFAPASGGTPPTVDVTCTPAATVVTAGASWTAPTGASCTVSVSGGTAPTNYTLGTSTYSATGATLSGSTFTMPGSGTVAVTATTTLIGDPQNVTYDAAGSHFVNGVGGATISGGTLPDVSMACTPVATGSSPNWTVPLDAECTLTLNTTGEVLPTGYAVDGVQFFVNGTQLITVKAQGTLYGGNTFKVQLAPTPGNTITFNRVLKVANTATVPIPALDVKALLLLMLLIGGIGFVQRKR